MTHKTPGQAAYDGYLAASDGKSLVSGLMLPTWDEQDPAIQRAWESAADAVNVSHILDCPCECDTR